MAEGYIRERKRKNGKIVYEVFIDAGKNPSTGKRDRKTKTFEKRSDATRWKNQTLTEIDQGTFTDAGRLTVGEFLKQWLEWKKASIGPSTYRLYSMIINKHLIPSLGKVELKKLSAIHIQDYYTKALTEGRIETKKDKDGNDRPTGLDADSVRRHHAVLSGAMKRAVIMRLIPFNIMDGVEQPQGTEKRFDWLTDEMATKYLEAAKEVSVYYPLFLMELSTALRQGELLKLKWSDVDLDNHKFSIFSAANKGGTTAMAMSDEVVTELEKWKETQDAWESLAGPHWKKTGLVFTMDDGRKVRPEYISKREHKRILEAAGMKDKEVRFHDLRHSVASILLQKGYNLKEVQEYLRHSSIRVTGDIYAHVVPKTKKTMADDLSNSITKKKTSAN